MKNNCPDTSAQIEPPTAQGRGSLFEVSHRMVNSTRSERLPGHQPRAASALKTILVPLSLAGNSRAELETARNIALDSKAKVVLLHVVQLNIVGEERGIHRSRLLNDLCHNAEAQLRQLADSMGGRVNTDVLVCEGRPAEAIIETVRRLGVDMIIMSAHSHRRWLKWLHRNTVRDVIRRAPCGIWLISPEQEANSVNLVVANHAAVRRPAERVMVQDRRTPVRSLLRVLFS
jgi:nucleotide-binding universal stress UspA family protein